MRDHREDIAKDNEKKGGERTIFHDEKRENEIGETLLPPSKQLESIGIELDTENADLIDNHGEGFNFERIKRFKENGFCIDNDARDILIRDALLLSNEELMFCKKHWAKFIREVKETTKTFRFIQDLQKINKWTIKTYIQEKEKQEKLLSDEEFQKLFGWKGKYNKADINQGWLWLCYFYTVLEILKKRNYFNMIIQTNLKQTQEWREVRIPFFSWDWIYVNTKEIDNKYKVKDPQGWLRKFSINSDSSLWFKILEIAFIKEEIKRRAWGNDNISSGTDDKEKKQNWNNKLTGKEILSVEDGYTKQTFKRLLPNCTESLRIAQDEIDEAFDKFKTGLYSVELLVKEKITTNGNIIEHTPNNNDRGAIVKDVKILNNKGEEYTTTIEKCPSRWILDDNEVQDRSMNYMFKHEKDKYKSRRNPYKHTTKQPYFYENFVNNEKGEQITYFFAKHAYSIEKCYTTPSEEKRVQVINPRHTWIKFDISLEEAKNIFDRTCIFINPDKLFPSSEKK